MSGEMKVNRWRLPLIVGALVVLAGAIAVVAGVLVARDQVARAAPSPSASSAAGPADPGGRLACGLNKTAGEQDRLLNPDAIGAIRGAAKESPNDSIRIRAEMLSQRYELAAAARGGRNEARFTLDLHTASLELRTACIQAGYL